MHTSISVKALKAMNAINESTQLQNLLDRIVELDEIINEQVKQLAASNDGNFITNKASEIRQSVLNLTSVISQTDAREFFREVEALDKELLNLFEDENGFSSLHEIPDAVDKFADNFNSFVQGRAPLVGSDLIFNARKTALSLKNFKNFLEFLIKGNHDDAPTEGEAEFSLILQNTYDLDDFIGRLISISELYVELAQILGVPSQSMRVAKIESGSLFTRLIGDTKVVALLVDLLKDTASFLHRNYTFEGKVGLISSQVDAFDKILDFNKKLEEAGVNVEKNKEQIAKGVHSISKNLTNLLADQATVVVDENIFSLRNAAGLFLLGSDVKRRLSMNSNERVDPTFDPNAPGLPPPR